MIKSKIVQQYTRRVLAHGKSGCLFRSLEALPAANQPTSSWIHTVTDQNEKWSKQGHRVKPSDVRCFIKNLRDSNQFSKALEASEWMGEQKVFDIFAEDYAARLYLVDHVLGLEEAEKFFESIPVNMRDYFVYSTLLNSYTRSEKTLDKAEATFEKMRELGFLLKPSPFNSMISLYGQLKNRDMVENLVREMKENKVGFDGATWNNVLKVYADPSKIKEMETFKTRVDEQGVKLEGSTIVAMARVYVLSGSVEKAIEMYGDVPGTQREVYALWNEYKKEAKDGGY
ncbi:hypothetical protein Bca4012_060565 [Brassica carinata]|uniref:PROP1-like PPR domain-containing protein n=1 Tax=Brassica carinata TaxID=52824 RepID=A0A8X7S9R3_BRACI|nr:hypothetical protein Bca52824_030897 [Brassica carinata]